MTFACAYPPTCEKMHIMERDPEEMHDDLEDDEDDIDDVSRACGKDRSTVQQILNRIDQDDLRLTIIQAARAS